MGMFDYVNVSIKCPQCSNIIQDFQTKDRENNMIILEVEEVNNFYSFCTVCKYSIEFIRKEKIKRLINLDDLKRDFKLIINVVNGS